MNNCKRQCQQNKNQLCPNKTRCDDLPMSKCVKNIKGEMHCCCDVIPAPGPTPAPGPSPAPGPTPGPKKGCLTGSLYVFECNQPGFERVDNNGEVSGSLNRRYMCDPTSEDCTSDSKYYCRKNTAPLIVNHGSFYKPNTILKGKIVTEPEQRAPTHPGGSTTFAKALGNDTGLVVLVKNVSKGGRTQIQGQLLDGELVVLETGNTNRMEDVALVCLNTPSGPVNSTTTSCFTDTFGNPYIQTAIVRDLSGAQAMNLHDKVAYWSTETDKQKNLIGLLGECENDGSEFLYPIESPLYTLEDRDLIRYKNKHLWCGI